MTSTEIDRLLAKQYQDKYRAKDPIAYAERMRNHAKKFRENNREKLAAKAKQRYWQKVASCIAH